LTDTDYVEPGVLWWAFDRDDAASRGVGRADSRATGSQASEPFRATNASRSPDHAVVLIDEIDKADPDVPNALLVPLGSNQFIVRETQVPVTALAPMRSDEPLASPVLVVITSNGERDLPPAFLRRCVSHQLQPPEPARLVQIARAHAAIEGRTLHGTELQSVTQLATKAVEIRDDLARAGRKGAGTAEFLDAVRASRELAISDSDPDTWNKLLTLTLRKSAARS
jgi:MoxR-like ATPase